MRLVPAAFLACAASVLLAACAAPHSSPSRTDYAALIASPDRADADRRMDDRRKPGPLLAFIGVQPGMKALDLSAGRGYTSELLARAVGPTGVVYAQARQANPTLQERSKKLPQLVVDQRPLDDPAPPEVASGGLDVVTLIDNYHDFGHMNVDRAKVNAAVFRALKPGGTFVIADHAGRPGTGISESGTLHRIEESFLQREVEAAGFRVAARGDFLRNPADPRDAEEPPFPKDGFVLKFVKPQG